MHSFVDHSSHPRVPGLGRDEELIIQDTLECLGLEEMKMSCLKAKPQAADDEENPEVHRERKDIYRIFFFSIFIKYIPFFATC